MSRRLEHFSTLRRNDAGATIGQITVNYEQNRSRLGVRDFPHVKWNYEKTLAAITKGQRIPMKREKAERLATKLCK